MAAPSVYLLRYLLVLKIAVGRSAAVLVRYGLPLDQISVLEEHSPVVLCSTFLISRIWALSGEKPLQFAFGIPLLRISSITSYLWWRGRASVTAPKGIARRRCPCIAGIKRV
jgi:hypothetical protein